MTEKRRENLALIDRFLPTLGLTYGQATTKLTRELLTSFINRFPDKSILDKEISTNDIREWFIEKKVEGEKARLEFAYKSRHATPGWTSLHTFTNSLAAIKILYRWLVDEKGFGAEHNPVSGTKIRLPRKRPQPLPVLNMEEERRILKYAEAPIIPLVNRAVFFLMYSTGLRPIEVARIKKDHNLNLAMRSVYIPQEYTKGGLMPKKVYFCEKAKHYLSLYIVKDTNSPYGNWLFHYKKKKMLFRQRRSSEISSLIREIIDLAYPYQTDLPGLRRSGYLLRRTMITRWMELTNRSVALKEIAGWSSFKMLDVYTKLSDSFVQAEAMKFIRKRSKAMYK